MVQVLVNFSLLFLELQSGIAIFVTVDLQAPENLDQQDGSDR